MSAATACSFLLLCIGVLTGSGQVGGHVAFLLGALPPYVALVGYVISASGLYTFGPFGSMAVNTSVSLLLLALGGLTIDASSWLRRVGVSTDIAAIVIRRLVPPCLIIFPVLGFLATHGAYLGLWASDFGPVIIVVGGSLFSGGLVVWTALSLGRIDRQRLTSVALAESDPLTGAGNRRFLDRVLLQTFTEQRRSPAALLAMDLDGFKTINDRHGHDEGDRALIGFVACVQANTRITDVFARTGGDEFALFVTDTTEEQAIEISTKLQEALAFWQLQRPEARPGVSIGIGILDADTRSPEALMKRADLSLYEAKSFSSHEPSAKSDELIPLSRRELGNQPSSDRR